MYRFLCNFVDMIMRCMFYVHCAATGLTVNTLWLLVPRSTETDVPEDPLCQQFLFFFLVSGSCSLSFRDSCFQYLLHSTGVLPSAFEQFPVWLLSYFMYIVGRYLQYMCSFVSPWNRVCGLSILKFFDHDWFVLDFLPSCSRSLWIHLSWSSVAFRWSLCLTKMGIL